MKNKEKKLRNKIRQKKKEKIREGQHFFAASTRAPVKTMATNHRQQLTAGKQTPKKASNTRGFKHRLLGFV